MRTLILEVGLAILGVLLAPFVIQGLFDVGSRAAKIAQGVAGTGLVVFFVVVWGRYGRDPLQITYCLINPAARSCPKPEITPATLVGTWRDAKASSCANGDGHDIRYDGRVLAVTTSGVTFKEHIERIDTDFIQTAVDSPSRVRSQRFQFRPTEDRKAMDIVPIYGGDEERWIKCS